MPDERAVELVHRQIDGEITQAEAQELQELRRRDEEIDAFFLDICAVCEALDSVRLAEPPSRFAEMVARRIHDERDASPAAIPFPSRREPRRMRFALALSAAALLALIFLTPLLIRRHDTSNMSGAMTPPAPAATAVLAEAAVATAGVSGTLRVEGAGRDVRVACLLAAGGEGEIAIEYDPHALRLVPAPGLEGRVIEERRSRVTLRAPPWSDRTVGFHRLSGAATSVKVVIKAEGGGEQFTMRLAPSDE